MDFQADKAEKPAPGNRFRMFVCNRSAIARYIRGTPCNLAADSWSRRFGCRHFAIDHARWEPSQSNCCCWHYCHKYCRAPGTSAGTSVHSIFA